jgi:hypothetical protein
MWSRFRGTSCGRTAIVVWLGFLAIPLSAAAAPFCVQSEALPQQCIYYDASECNQRAQQLGGTCTVNTEEVSATAGLGHYCLFTSNGVSLCIYADRGSCNQEAEHQQGVCVMAPNVPESPAPDPYRDIRPLMAGGG